jgi:hypothetical protein
MVYLYMYKHSKLLKETSPPTQLPRLEIVTLSFYHIWAYFYLLIYYFFLSMP